MRRKVDDKNKVSKELLECYEDIDIFDVIREALLCKGEGVVFDGKIHKKFLEDSALYLYGLKAGATNRLYVGMILDKLSIQNDLADQKSDKYVKVPKEIYNEVKSINDKFSKRKDETK